MFHDIGQVIKSTIVEQMPLRRIVHGLICINRICSVLAKISADLFPHEEIVQPPSKAVFFRLFVCSG